MDKLRIIGTSQPVSDSWNKVTGKTKFTADMKMDGMLHGVILRSPHAHAKILSIDTSVAEKMPGVRAIAHCFNAPDVRYNRILKNYDYTDEQQLSTEYVYPKIVRFAGERVLSIAADTEKQAKDAVKTVQVEYEILPAILSIDEALNEENIQIHPHHPNLLCDKRFAERGNVEEVFQKEALVFEDVYETPIVNHVAIETHAVIAHYDSEGKATIITPTQSAFSVRSVLSKIFQLPMNKIRVIKPPIGGAFGNKIPAILEPQALLLSKMTNRPVKMVLSRKEEFLVNTRHASKIRIKTAVAKDGKLLAQEIDSVINTGAHAADGVNVAGALASKAFYMYQVDNLKVRSRCVMTNLPSAGAMRGYGSPQIFFAQQSQFHKIAAALQMDFVDFQEKNAITKEYHGGEFGNTYLLDAIKRGRELFDWNNRKKEDQDHPEIKRGIGMAVACHGNGVFRSHRDFAGITLKANEDGTFSMHTGAHEMGTGVIKTQLMIVAEVLGLEVDDLTYVECDTDVVPHNIGDYASRGVFVQGNAAMKSAEKMKDVLLDLAVQYLNTPLEKLELTVGGKIKSALKQATFSELILFAHRELQRTVQVEESYSNEGIRMSYGAHFAEVEVNTKTSEVRVVDYVAVHDVGRVMNRMILEGQLHGGIQMGLGYALSEEYTFNELGVHTNGYLKKYKVFHAKDMPQIHVDFIESIDYPGPFGGKSIGECATNAVAPAVTNAISNALGTTFTSLPVKVKS